jgi:ribonuclease D
MTNEKNDEARMTSDEKSTTARRSDFVIPSTFDIRHSSLSTKLIATGTQLSELLAQIEPLDRVAIDTEADSLHCYREKLCLLQVSVPGCDFIVDPLANIDLSPLCSLLETKEIVLQGADFDLRLLRRSLNFRAHRIFDTVIAARLLGIREFSLAALTKRFFGVELPKGSQKANWARRPLPARMAEYAVNDTHYLLPLAEQLESRLRERGRLEWLRQSCQRAIEQAAVERRRDLDEAWRIPGSGGLRGRAAALLRELWQWREMEAQASDRPPFHILQNQQLIQAAQDFAAGTIPEFQHFSLRRRREFRIAAERALQLSEDVWPIKRRGFGARPSAEIAHRYEELKHRRDRVATELELEPAFLASRGVLEAIAADQTQVGLLLLPWQKAALGQSGH